VLLVARTRADIDHRLLGGTALITIVVFIFRVGY
jgi:hypothetical protein